MSQATHEAEGRLFAQMDAKAREVIERKFRVRLDSSQSTENQQAAWDVYQNSTVKLMKAIRAEARIDDPAAYAATVARNSCRDHWRLQNPGWADLKGRLHRFFRKQPAWEMWENDQQLGWICGPAGWQDKEMAAGGRVNALLDKPRRIDASALPKVEMVERLDSTAWDRLLQGFFDYLQGPVRLDDLVSIAGVLFGVKGSREMVIGGPDGEDDRPAWEPAGKERPADEVAAMREVLVLLWNEIKGMPKRWVLPFLLNPPVAKGSAGRRPRNRGGIPEGEEVEKPDRGELEVFTSNGIATIAEIAALVGFSAEHYAILWSDLAVVSRGDPPLDAVPDPLLRFAVLWKHLPLEDDLIARVMGLESSQKVINLRMVAKTHLAKTLAAKKIGAGG
jgi:hypothetical protein